MLVGMGHVGDELASLDLDLEAMAHLARQCLGVALAVFDAPPGKLPHERQRGTRPALGDEVALPIGDDGSHDTDPRELAHAHTVTRKSCWPMRSTSPLAKRSLPRKRTNVPLELPRSVKNT